MAEIDSRIYLKNLLKVQTDIAPDVVVKNDTGVIVFDTETTGLDSSADQILQLSVIDGNYKTLLNTYICPVGIDEWPEAEAVNHISPAMVKNAPRAEDVIAKAKAVFGSAQTWIAYNGNFDLQFLKYLGISPSEGTIVIDVMREFAEAYGEEDDYHGGYKWKKLTFAARYYGFRWGNGKAHDSCADCAATLYVHQNIMEEKVEEENGETDKEADPESEEQEEKITAEDILRMTPEQIYARIGGIYDAEGNEIDFTKQKSKGRTLKDGEEPEITSFELLTEDQLPPKLRNQTGE